MFINYNDSLVVTLTQKAQYTFHTAITLPLHVLEKHYLHKSLIFLLSSITIYNFKTPDKMLTVLGSPLAHLKVCAPAMLLLPTARNLKPRL